MSHKLFPFLCVRGSSRQDELRLRWECRDWWWWSVAGAGVCVLDGGGGGGSSDGRAC